MTAEARKRPPTPDETTGGENDLRYYTAEELVDPEGEFRLPTTARMLHIWAHQRKIPHSRMGGRVRFRLPHIRATAELFDEPALALPNQRKKPAA